MLLNYFKLAIRHLRRHLGYAVINIGGLSLGLAVCLLVALFVQHELSFDRFHQDANRIFRVVTATESGYEAVAPWGTPKVFANQFPEVADATVVDLKGERLFHQEEGHSYIDQVVMTDQNFFDLFSFSLIRGDPDEVLDGPGEMVITEDVAERLFGGRNPVGRTLTYETNERAIQERQRYEITGVVEDPAANSHLQFNVLLSLSEQERPGRYSTTLDWRSAGVYTYLRVQPDADPQTLQTKIRRFIDRQKSEAAGTLKAEAISELRLQPLTDIHLSDLSITAELDTPGDIRFLYLFSAIGVLILLVACINYMNLATARSTRRRQEVGIRKVVGAGRQQLIGQFLGEAVLISLMALPLAAGIVYVGWPVIEQILGRKLVLYYGAGASLFPFLLGLVLIVGVIAGSYPALVLSGFVPAKVLKGSATGREPQDQLLRRALVVFQFVTAVTLVIGALTVWQQLEYLQTKNLGFDDDQVVVFRSRPLLNQFDAFDKELEREASIVSVSQGLPPGVGYRGFPSTVTDPQTGKRWHLTTLPVDYDYLGTLGMTVKTGRNFSRQRASDDETAIILNETAARRFGFEDDPIGKQISLNEKNHWTVIGVVEDFHNETLRAPIGPVALTIRRANFYGVARLREGNIDQGLTALRRVWNKFQPNRPFTYEFLDDRIDAQYRDEEQMATIFGLFSSITVLIACAGIFGLSAFVAEQRTQEVGIRKVLGATVGQIVTLLSEQFLRLVVLALVVAIPLGHILASRWLQDFAYHINLGPSIYLVASGIGLAVTFLTVSYQSIKAALTNPADSLRYE